MHGTGMQTQLVENVKVLITDVQKQGDISEVEKITNLSVCNRGDLLYRGETETPVLMDKVA